MGHLTEILSERKEQLQFNREAIEGQRKKRSELCIFPLHKSQCKTKIQAAADGISVDENKGRLFEIVDAGFPKPRPAVQHH